MNVLARPAILLFVGSALGCATTPPPESGYPSAPSGSYSSSGSAVGTSAGVPAHENVTAGVVVRPDLLCVPFAVRAIDPDPEKAVAAAQAMAQAVGQRFAAIAGGGAVRMRGVAVAASYGIGKSAPEDAKYALVADGAFEVPLPATLDFWGRSKLVAALVAASKKEPREIAFEAPQLRVADPEAHRAQLTKQWVERARAFGDAAQSPTAPLALGDCSTPGEITQRAISTEEVVLTLTVACKLEIHGK